MRKNNYALLLAYLSMLACVVVRPEALSGNNGLSYFGLYRSTIVPYAASLLLYATFFLDTGELITGEDQVSRWLSRTFRLMAVLAFCLLITPFSLLGRTHIAIGIALYAVQYLASFWLVAHSRRWFWQSGLLAAETVAGVASFLYLNKPEGFLMAGQVLFQVAFGIIIMLNIYRHTEL